MIQDLSAFIVPTTREATSEKVYKISHSQLGVFQKCEQAWYYSYVDELTPKETKSYFRRGTFVHEMLHVYDQTLQQGVPPGSNEALNIVLQFASTDIEGGLHGGELEDYTRALASCTKFIREFSPAQDQFIKVLGVEEYFEVTLRTPKGRLVSIEGYIDRIYRQAGNLWVLDRKSSSTGRHYKESEILMDGQLTTYAAVLKLMGYDVFGVAIDSISTYPYKDFQKQPADKLFKRIHSYRSEKELAFALQNYLRVADKKIDMHEQYDTPVRRLTRECDRCQFQDLCLYEMKGIDTTMLIAEKFKRKTPRTADEANLGLRLRYDESKFEDDSGESEIDY